jgi:hypothetical protein
VKGKIESAFASIGNKVKQIFGIASPSKMFMGIGQNLVLGLEEGFTDAMPRAVRAMEGVLPSDFGIRMRNTSMPGAAGGTTINQQLTITTPKALSEKELAREFKNMNRKLALSLA